MTVPRPNTFHVLVTLPESVPVDEWLHDHDLAEWGERGKGWSEHREPMRSVLGPPPRTRYVALIVPAVDEPAASMRVAAAVSVAGGAVLSVVHRAASSEDIAKLERELADLTMDNANYLVAPTTALSPARAEELCDQAAEVARHRTHLVDLGYGAHPTVRAAQGVLDVVMQALTDHPPVADAA